jgi:hypothetical protein
VESARGGLQVINLDTAACVHCSASMGPWPSFTIWAWCTGVVRPMALGLATNEVLGMITHDPLEEGGL